MTSFALLLMPWTSNQSNFKRSGPALATSKCSYFDFYFVFGAIWDLPLGGPSWEELSGSGIFIIQVMGMLGVQIKQNELTVELNVHFSDVQENLYGGFLNSKYDLPVQEKLMQNFFCMGGWPSVHHTSYAASDFLFGMKCLWTLKNKVGIGIRI